MMKEFDIRPSALFDEFLSVAKQDIDLFFSDQKSFVEVACPACDSADAGFGFIKHGLTYRICHRCGSLYVSPRPTQEMIDRYYTESASSKFWAERFFPETADARRVQIFRPRAQMLTELIERLGAPSPRVLADVGAGYGLFLEESRSVAAWDQMVAIEPGHDLAERCRDGGFTVIELAAEKVAPETLQASVMTSFEVLEHLYAPDAFLAAIRDLLLPGGLFVFTTLTISGWDMQVLWDQSKSISPPHHLNLLSIEGLELLVERVGLRLEEITTPGKLDVDIVRNALAEDCTLSLPRFVEYLLHNRGDETLEAFQAFLQQHRLSSHVRVVARRPSA